MMVIYMNGFSPTAYWIVVTEALHVQLVGASTEAHLALVGASTEAHLALVAASTEAHLALVVASVETVFHDHLALGYIDG